MIICNFEHKTMRFPCGEIHVQVGNPLGVAGNVFGTVSFEYQSNEEIIELALLTDALRGRGISPETLHMPYVPFGRQDRVANPGENFSLRVFADLINGLNFQRVCIVDPHSDVTTALLKNVTVTEQHEVFAPYLKDLEGFWLISPDAGATKKIHKLAALTRCAGVVQCGKVRDTKTGKILATEIYAKDLGGQDAYIVDDLCDGGRTFTEIAKKLKTMNVGKITLMVTHGFFTAGLGVFDGLIDSVYTRKGVVYSNGMKY